jgi:hypothetical protein
MNKSKTIFYTCISFGIFLCACSQGHKKGPLSPVQTAMAAKLDSLQQLVQQTNQAYHAMSSPDLLQKLTEQSVQRREPFNSLAFRELKDRKDVNKAALVAMVKAAKNADGLLPLLLLRKLDEKMYTDSLPVELRAEILTNALETSKTFNTWGLPPYYIEPPSKAIIECNKAAVPALKRMLEATSPAPLFGSQEATLSRQLQYRLCDYALYYLELINGNEKFALPTLPAQRDSLIKEIK